MKNCLHLYSMRKSCYHDQRNEHPERYRWWLSELSFGTTIKKINKLNILGDKYSVYVKDAIYKDSGEEDSMGIVQQHS